MVAHGGEGGSILYVEDDALSSQLVHEIAALVPGTRLRVERTIEAARRALAGERFDVLLVDVGLPDGSGLDLIADAAGLAERPAVHVVTGDDRARLAAMARGADGVLVKPYPVADLVGLLRVATGSRRGHV